MQNLKLAVRRVVASPFVTVVAVASLALGIGANAAIFSMFDQILLKSLPVTEADRLVNLAAPGPKPGSTSCGMAGDCEVVFSYPMFRDLEGGDTGFSHIAAHASFGANIASGSQTVSGEGLFVSGGYFPALGLRPTLGRLLAAGDDEREGQGHVVVLSHDFWTARTGSDPAVLNGTIVVNGESLTVVGVAPRGFRGTTLGDPPDLFVPLSMRGTVAGSMDELENRTRYWAYLFGRLAPGVEMEAADRRISALYSRIVREVETPLQADVSEDLLARFREKKIELSPGNRGQRSIFQEATAPLILLLAVTGTVLMIAGANVANLLIAQGARRETEMAVRSALGADRGRLLRQVLLEAVVLALIGGVVSLGVAWGTLTVISGLLPVEISSSMGLELQPSVFLFTGVVAVIAGLGFGMFPALHTTRRELLGLVRTAGARGGGSRAAARFRSGLVVGQVTLSMALLVMAGLFVQSLSNVSRVDLGLETDQMVTFTIEPGRSGYEADERTELYRQVTDRVAALPGVTRVTAAMVPTLAGSRWGTTVSVQGIEWDPERNMGSNWNEVGPGYFSTMGIPLMAGREFGCGWNRLSPGGCRERGVRSEVRARWSARGRTPNLPNPPRRRVRH